MAVHLLPVPECPDVMRDEEPFGACLRRLRLHGTTLSQNQLAHRAGIDPAYVNRLERGGCSLPSRRVVLALWRELGAGPADRERLLVKAGLCPEVILAAGGWDGYLRRVRSAILDLERSLSEGTVGDLA